MALEKQTLLPFSLNSAKIVFETARCQQDACGIQLSAQNSRYLHIHHKNSLKNDCRPENLVCLCIRCHAQQPNHSHIKSLFEYTEFISKFL